MNISTRRGFTLIEILIVIGIMAVLATIVIVAINPSRQFAQARNTQRVSNVNTILNAIGQKIVECRGKFNASTEECPSSPQCPTLVAGVDYVIASSGALNAIDLACLTPTYIPSGLPYDPSFSGAQWTSATNYNTQYSISLDVNGRFTVSAPGAELGQKIFATR